MSFPDNIENSELDELYTQVIFDHYKNPRNKRPLNKSKSIFKSLR